MTPWSPKLRHAVLPERPHLYGGRGPSGGGPSRCDRGFAHPQSHRRVDRPRRRSGLGHRGLPRARLMRQPRPRFTVPRSGCSRSAGSSSTSFSFINSPSSADSSRSCAIVWPASLRMPGSDLILIAFSFGAFLEGMAGFGAPVAITAAIPDSARLQNRSTLPGWPLSPTPHRSTCFGFLSGSRSPRWSRSPGSTRVSLSAMVGRQLPFFSLMIPFWLVTALRWLARRARSLASRLDRRARPLPCPSSRSPLCTGRGWWISSPPGLPRSPRPSFCSARVWRPGEIMTLADGEIRRSTSAELPRKGRRSVAQPDGGLPRLDALGDPDRVHPLLGFAADEIGVRSDRRSEVSSSASPRAGPADAARCSGQRGARGRPSSSSTIFGHGHRHPRRRLAWPALPWVSIRERCCAPTLGPSGGCAGPVPSHHCRHAAQPRQCRQISRDRRHPRSGPGPYRGALIPFRNLAALAGSELALTGSDTASDVLFGSLQKITSEQLGISPILMGAANSSGGVMGEMVDAQSDRRRQHRHQLVWPRKARSCATSFSIAWPSPSSWESRSTCKPTSCRSAPWCRSEQHRALERSACSGPGSGRAPFSSTNWGAPTLDSDGRGVEPHRPPAPVAVTEISL